MSDKAVPWFQYWVSSCLVNSANLQVDVKTVTGCEDCAWGGDDRKSTV